MPLIANAHATGSAPGLRLVLLTARRDLRPQQDAATRTQSQEVQFLAAPLADHKGSDAILWFRSGTIV